MATIRTRQICTGRYAYKRIRAASDKPNNVTNDGVKESLTTDWDDNLDPEANHVKACNALCDALDWPKERQIGIFDGDYYHVHTSPTLLAAAEEAVMALNPETTLIKRIKRNYGASNGEDLDLLPGVAAVIQMSGKIYRQTAAQELNKVLRLDLPEGWSAAWADRSGKLVLEVYHESFGEYSCNSVSKAKEVCRQLRAQIRADLAHDVKTKRKPRSTP